MPSDRMTDDDLAEIERRCAEKPFWFPRVVGPDTVAQLRKDYDLSDSMDDESVLATYEYWGRYENTSLWDHCGDAAEDYEPLADAYLLASDDIPRLLAELRAVREERDGLAAACVATTEFIRKFYNVDDDSIYGGPQAMGEIQRAGTQEPTKEKLMLQLTVVTAEWHSV